MMLFMGGDIMAYEVITIKENDMVSMILSGYNMTDIAKKLNVNRTTLYDWLKKDNVRAELDRRQQELKNRATLSIVREVDAYIDNLKDLAKKSTDQRVKFLANKYLVDCSLKLLSENESSNGDDAEDILILEERLRRIKLKKK